MANGLECLRIIQGLYLRRGAKSNPHLRKWPAVANGVIGKLEPWKQPDHMLSLGGLAHVLMDSIENCCLSERMRETYGVHVKDAALARFMGYHLKTSIMTQGSTQELQSSLARSSQALTLRPMASSRLVVHSSDSIARRGASKPQRKSYEAHARIKDTLIQMWLLSMRYSTSRFGIT